MAKAKSQIEMPEELLEDGLEAPTIDLDAEKISTNFGNAMAQNKVLKDKSNLESIEALDLSEGEEDFNMLEDEPDLNRYVLAKYVGTSGSPDANHEQTIQGIKAIFPLHKLVVVKFMYVKAARRSGYVDFVSNPGKKNMKKVDNLPTIVVQDSIPDEFQDDNKIMDFIELVYETKGKRLLMACDSL